MSPESSTPRPFVDAGRTRTGQSLGGRILRAAGGADEGWHEGWIQQGRRGRPRLIGQSGKTSGRAAARCRLRVQEAKFPSILSMSPIPSKSGLVSMIGLSHFPTGGPIASLTRFSIFLLPSAWPAVPSVVKFLGQGRCAFVTASINARSAPPKP